MKDLVEWQVINQYFDGTEKLLETCIGKRAAENAKHRWDKQYACVIIRQQGKK